MDERLKYIYVGVDTHKCTHTAVIIDFFGDKLGEIEFINRPSAFDVFLDEVKKVTKKGRTAVFGLEDTGGSGRALAAYLINKKKIVKRVDSTSSSLERKTKAVSNKTDSHDALCIARVLSNKFAELPKPELHDIYWTLSMLVGKREACVKASTALKNQLHSYLVHHYPSYRNFFNQFGCNTALAFWEAYPSPSKLLKESIENIGDLLRKSSSNYFSISKAEEILEIVKGDGYTTAEYQDNRDFLVQSCVRELRHYGEEIKRIENEMNKILSGIDYRLETMKGINTVTAAALIAEIGDIGRFSSADKLASYAGISPVERSSGESSKRFRNKQGNRKLYEIFRNLANRQIGCGRNGNTPVNAIFYEYYIKQQKNGKTKHQAIILVMRRLVNIIYGMMKNRTEYVHPNLSLK